MKRTHCLRKRLIATIFFGFGLSMPLQADSGEWSGWLNGQTRYYGQTGENVTDQVYPSVGMQLNYSKEFSEQNSAVVSVFARGDSVDDERNYMDVRELLWLHYADDYQIRAGIGQVSWGANELLKITDLINQKDRAELPHPRKLGQPMASVSFYWGEDLIELYTLYGLRKAWFPGEDGRLKYPILVNPDEEEYEWGKTGHWDFAAKWKTRLGDWDLGFSHFYGMTRDPYFIFNYDFNDPYLIPVYEKVNQTSMDAVYAWNDVLLKFEATYQIGSLEKFGSVAGGVEYTQGGIFESSMDLTWYVEALWDSREHIYASLLDHDVAVAARLALNDARDSNLVLSVVADYEYNEAMAFLFWTNTFGQSWTLNITGQYFLANEPRIKIEDYEEEISAFVAEIDANNYPLADEVVDDLLAIFQGTTINREQYKRIVEQLNEIQNAEDYFNQVDLDTVSQTIFDLIRTSDNTQKMNLIERDAYIQFDIFYHF